MNTWIDRFARMSPEERAMTVAEDPSTFTALVNEAAVMQDWYRRWRLARDADPPTQPDDLSGPAGGALVGQTEPTESTGPYLCACTCGCVDMTLLRGGEVLLACALALTAEQFRMDRERQRSENP